MKKSNTSALVIIIVVILVIIVGIYFAMRKSNPPVTSDIPVDQNQTTPPPATQELFTNSPLAQYSYLISDPTMDANAKKATIGYTFTRTTLTDGSIQIVVKKPKASDFQPETYIVQPGEKLYFIERQPGDDVVDTDSNLGDDQVVLVDVNGYIINQ